MMLGMHGVDWPRCASASVWLADTAPNIASGPQTMPLPGATAPMAVLRQVVLKQCIAVPA